MTWKPVETEPESFPKRKFRKLKSVFKNHFNEFVLSFPIHLAIYNVKSNHVLLSFWLLLWAFVSGTIGDKMGFSYLFLDPEYMNEVSGWSFFIMGLAFSSFTMAFHITCYILGGYRYTFLGIMRFPLLQFSINNSIIPIIFFLYYLVKIAIFQRTYEGESWGNILWEISVFLSGMFMMFLLTFLYFRFTSKRFFKSFANTVDKQLKKGRLQRVNVMERLHKVQNERVIIHSYFQFPFMIAPINNNYPYDKRLITKVFDQTQLNAVIIQIVILLVLFGLGLFRDIPIFQIPAAASAIMLFTILLMISGAIAYWLKEWAFSLVIVIFLLVWKVIPENSNPTFYHQAFGMNYDSKADYSLKRIQELSSPKYVEKDKKSTLAILNRWRANFPDSIPPKLVISSSSGGGMRSSVWSLRTLQFADSALNGKLMKHSVLMTGSSGGMIGMAYFRELYLRNLENQLPEPLNSKSYLEKIAKDKLNPTIFSLVVSDLFFRFQRFNIGNKSYFKDRGYSLERQILIDVDSVLDKSILAYREPERQAKIPMMILSPTIVNDGRRLFISAQDVSYMNLGSDSLSRDLGLKVRGIEFRKFFEAQQADSLRFVTALRMNATFPYITPNVILPSKPGMAIMDAGLIDNFGVTDAVQFLHTFRDWISENTSGVVLVTIRDKPKERELEMAKQSGNLNQLLAPVNSLAQNLFAFQDMNNDRLLQSAETWLNQPLDVVNFQYEANSKKDGYKQASLSWRLTTKEKKDIASSIYSEYNQFEMERLKSLLE
ncbi:MAG: hypothetical protein ACI81T_003645 [Bacteroidia bacterium]|jgi:hypothetical protein